MEIKPTYVTFEQAKALKEKGFDEPCKMWFDWINKKPLLHEKSPLEEGDELYKNSDFDTIPSNMCCAAPEQWQVVEWLRVEKGIWIEVRHIKTFGINRFHLIIRKYGEEDYRTIHCDNGVGYEVWDSPQEAYSAAFDYILNNLL